MALWDMYLGGYLEAMDILFVAMGWMGAVDRYLMFVGRRGRGERLFLGWLVGG